MARLTDNQLIQELWARRQKLAETRDHLARVHGWDVHDIRLAVFTKIEHAVGCTALGFESMTEFLCTHRQHRDRSFRYPINQSVAAELAGFYKLGFIQFVFSAVESSLRALLRALKPTAANNGTAEFKSIYDCLIRTELSLPSGQAGIDVLDFFRALRNTLHNNGVSFHKLGTDITISYRGTSYEFIHGQKIGFAYWDLCLALIDDVLDLVTAVIVHQRVTALPFTRDPFASTTVVAPDNL